MKTYIFQIILDEGRSGSDSIEGRLERAGEQGFSIAGVTRDDAGNITVFMQKEVEKCPMKN